MATSYAPKYDRTKVLTGQARMFTQALDPDNPPALPEDSLALGAEWPELWLPIGATSEGMQFAFSRDTQDIRIEEQVTAVDVKTTSLTFNVNVTLAEDTFESMRLAYGGGRIETTPAGEGQVGKRRLIIATDLEQMAFAFEAKAPSGYWRRVLIPVVVSVGEVQTAYRRADGQRMYETSFRSLVAPEDVDIVEMDAPATSA